jgi:TolB-like protein/DNA-binding winged helix-turn-helix (wHTH) protein/Flp pilus assembly protein TadD
MGLGETTPRVLRFGVFELDRRSGELRKEGMRVRLQEQPLRILEALLDARGEPVTREALRQRLWPDETFVDFDSGLNRAINRLRAALGDEADNPRFIETLERRGYRFIAPVGAPEPAAPPAPEVAARPAPAAEVSSPATPRTRRAMWLGAAVSAAALTAVLIAFAPALQRRAAPASEIPIKSLAVLPLANLTGDPAQDYFSDGMTDALITNLASWPALRVISRQSVMRYKGSAKPLPEIARELGVEGVVEGSVARSAGRVRITAQLIHAPTDRHLWAHSYERRLEDVLALQDEVSRAIAEEVRITVTTDSVRRPARARTVNPEAYDAYLLGRHHWNQRSPQSLEKAAAYFRSAIAKDPDFAPAHAGLALTYGPRLIYGDIAPGRGNAEMKAAALKALELDAGLGEARAALASALAHEWDWDGAEREFRRAIEIDPNSSVAHISYGRYLYALGRFKESLAERRRALELDPLDVTVNRNVARSLDATGQDEAALAQWNRTMELDPNHLRSQVPFALFLLEHGRTDLGWQQLERARALQPEDPAVLASLAIASVESGKPDQARRLLAKLKEESGRRYVSPVFPAFVHTALGEKDSAFALLEKAYDARDPLLIEIRSMDTPVGLRPPPERTAALRADPRFADLVRRMGFPRQDAAGGPSTPASGAAEGRR